jgi:adenosylhomocysteine nucleosidase
MGSQRAEAAALQLLDRGATALVSWGSAGGLDPTLDAGTIVIPNHVRLHDGSEIAADSEWSLRLRSTVTASVSTSDASLLQIEEAIDSTNRKRELHLETGAGAVDMESGTVARVASRAGVPWIAVRAVLDTATQALPGLARTAVDADGHIDRAIGWRIATTPSQWRAMIGLALGQRAAGLAMGRVWSLAAPDLAHQPSDR